MTAPIPPLANSGWTVTGQSEQTQVINGSQFVDGVKVDFRTGNGATGSVFVPKDRYSADLVRSLISAQATELDAVHNLTSDN